MRAVLTLHSTLLGLASWTMPFVISLAFFGGDGQLAVDVFLFKTVMILIGGAIGVWLLLRAFRRVRPDAGTGLALGLYWAGLNMALDLAVLVGVMGTEPEAWLIGVGLRYLMIPIIAVGMGVMGARHG